MQWWLTRVVRICVIGKLRDVVLAYRYPRGEQETLSVDRVHSDLVPSATRAEGI